MFVGKHEGAFFSISARLTAGAMGNGFNISSIGLSNNASIREKAL
ncbi:MAG: hypothetical protein ACUVQV_01840 [Dissulfurimicrobium sp.]